MTTGPDDMLDSHEREWRLQEQARLDQQRAVEPAGSARALRYRLLAREFEQPLDAALPTHFPYAEAERIEAIAAERRRAGKRFERRLKGGFVAGYGVCMLAAALVYRDDVLAWLDAPMVQAVLSKPWLPALLGCVAFAYLLNIRPWRWLSPSRGRTPRRA